MAGRRVRLAEVGEQAVESIERRDSLNRVDGVLDGVSAGPRAGRFDPPAHQNLPLQHPTATRRRFLILLVITVLAVVATAAWFQTQGRSATPKYRLATVEKGPLTATVSATGTLNPVITVQVGSQVSGQIKELFADFNSQVKKDQLIARIDPEIFQTRVNQAQADLEAAEATILNQEALVERTRADVENARAALAVGKAQTAKAEVAVLDAKRDLVRKTELLNKGLVAQSDRDTSQATHDSAVAQFEANRAQEDALAAAVRSSAAQLKVVDAQLKTAQAQVRQKKAGLDQAQVDLDHTAIRAPVDGVVVSRNVDVGQTVAASLQAPTLFTIAQDLTRMQVDTNVDEADIGRIRSGQRATFTVDSFRGETFSGKVIQIRQAPQVIQNVTTYDVVLSAQNQELKLRPGMTANVRLVVDQKSSVLKVPNAALRFRPAGVEGEAPPSRGKAQAAALLEPGDGAGRSGDPIRDRLVRELDLTDEQQRKLDPILSERQEKLAAVQAGGKAVAKAERRSQQQNIRDAAREKIMELLTKEQRARFEPSMVDQPAARRERSGSVWVLGPDGEPKAIIVRLGLADANATEILEGELSEGQQVIVGSTERPAPRTGRGQSSSSLKL